MNLKQTIRRVLREEEKSKSIRSYDFPNYTLILSKNPCDVFDFYGVKEMHGLNKQDCMKYNNTKKDAYIAGLSNNSPINEKPFLFLNLSRLGNSMNKMGLIMHEMMHLSINLHNYNLEQEEEIITWAEEESYKIYKLI